MAAELEEGLGKREPLERLVRRKLLSRVKVVDVSDPWLASVA